MAAILATCPQTGDAVPTGQHTTPFSQEAVLNAGGRYRCPSCNQVHTWTREGVTLTSPKARLRVDGTVSTARD